ncbi:MAG: hypothetical protein J7604_19655 [Sporocytophaga sp.]|uniref:hypothetical protein n=1 Tax=Sporocytophaga sp. TaxID=2231183 RepID=UPI001B1D396C|nr:hypothetical protein [Sporocytophaga sp.]MBO9702436.1 hypothetical protein [Sporocytophaga sp.]
MNFFIKVVILFLVLNTNLAKARPVWSPADFNKEKKNLDSNHRSIQYGGGINLIPLSIFGVNAYFEYFLKNSNSLCFAVRDKPTLDFPIFGTSYEYIAANEVAFNFDYKISLGKNNYRYYIAPGVFYKRRWFKEKWIGYANGTQYESDQYLENMNLNIYGLRVILGKRAIMGSAYFDFYTGPGVTYNIGDYDYLDHYGGSSQFTFDPNYYFEKFSFSYHVGIHIGFLSYRK